MRERITFVHGADDVFKPEQLQLDNDTLHVKSLKAAREDRFTFSLHELPQEVSSIHLGSQLSMGADLYSYGES